MPWWVLVHRSGKKVKGLMGPYSQFRANQVADKLEVEYEVEYTNATEEAKVKRELREKLIQKKGFEEGSGNISSPVLEVDNEN